MKLQLLTYISILWKCYYCLGLVHLLHYRGISFQKTDKVSLVSDPVFLLFIPTLSHIFPAGSF